MKLINWLKKEYKDCIYKVDKLFFIKHTILNLGNEAFVRFDDLDSVVSFVNIEKYKLKHGVYYFEEQGEVVNITLVNITLNVIPDFCEMESILGINVYGCIFQFHDFKRIFNKLIHLKELTIVGDKIKEIPKSIGVLKNLESLSISSTKIIEIPKSIAQLTNLKILDIRNTGIKEIPDCIIGLSNLITLGIGGTEIKGLPECIRELSNLTTLNISGTEIKEIPRSISQLSNLKGLDVSNTEIKEIPEFIGRLSNLKKLDISGTKIKELPRFIGRLTNLTDFDVSGTEIKEIPDIISQLNNLMDFNISGTKIKELPEFIGQLSNLISLHLGYTLIKRIPETIGQLSKLTSLNISGVRIKEIPESIGQLSNLKSIHLSGTELEEIPECIGQLSNLTNLDISSTEIKEVPKSISKLSNLKRLDIDNTEIKELPECFGQLNNLTSLSMRRTKIKEIPECIGQLSNLKELDISGIKIKEIPENVGQLSGLTYLYLRNTELKEIPETIFKLSNLTVLDVGNTKIKEIPKDISRLSNLTSLDIGNTEIEEIPENLGQLSNLTNLRINGTKVKELPSSIGQLTNLTNFELSNTLLEQLPEFIYNLPLRSLSINSLTLDSISPRILDLNLKFILDHRFYEENVIDLSGTQIEETGTSIFKQPRNEIKLFFDELERGKVLLNEARVIFVGNGAAGKSTVINRIITDKYEEELKETRGVLIKKWKESDNANSPNISFWDFGGQAIMHSMHEFFLGERCLYVVVLDGRRDESPEYWLDIVSQYGKNSSVIIVMNKIDQNPDADIDKNKLQRDYGDVFEQMYFHRISCKNLEGFAQFKKELCEIVKGMESCKKMFPKRWYHIREKLANMSRNYIREDDYRNFCIENDIVDQFPQDTILKWMNDLGICFSYKSRQYIGSVNEIKVLRPEWITNGVYKIITSELAKKCNGFIKHSDIASILEESDDVNPIYRNTERDFILGMMRDFMLSYQVDSAEFIPMLTSESEPDLPNLQTPVQLQIKYDIPIPSAILYSFIVYMQKDIIRDKTWRRGTLLKNNYYQSRAIVRFGKTRNTIDIIVSGQGQSHYLAIIRQALGYVQADIDTQFDEYVFYTNERNKTAKLKLERILKMLRKGVREDYADDIDETVNLYDALSTFVPDEIIKHLNFKLKEQKEEIQNLKQHEYSVEELKDMIFSIKININETITEIKNIDIHTSEQMKQILGICEYLVSKENSEELILLLNQIKEEIVNNNTKKIKERFIEFIGVTGSLTGIATALYDVMPYIQKLIP